MDYQYGFDDDAAQFIIQYGFVVGFAPCMPSLACLAFVLDLGMLRGVVFKSLYVSNRDRPLTASGLGVWNRLFDAITVGAMVCNAVLLSELLTSGGVAQHISQHLEDDDAPDCDAPGATSVVSVFMAIMQCWVGTLDFESSLHLQACRPSRRVKGDSKPTMP